MNTTAQHSQLIKQQALSLGFAACGISQARFLEEEAPALEHYLQQHYHGQMGYLANHFDKRLDPRQLVPGAQSVVSLLLNYYPAQTQLHPDAPRIAKYAYGQDYHTVIKDKLAALLQYIRQEIGEVSGRAFVDSAPVLDKAWARLSGLGWVGKNGNLLNARFGSFFFVAELIIDLPLAYDAPTTDHCGQCTRCIDACPTQAIVAPRVVNGSRCISYFTIELREAIPPEMKGTFQNWAFGCDVCQDVCPWNRRAKPHTEAALRPKDGLLEMDKQQWYELTEELFGQLFQGSALQRTKYSGLRRNLDFLRPDADSV